MQTKCYGYLNFNKRMNDEEDKKNIFIIHRNTQPMPIHPEPNMHFNAWISCNGLFFFDKVY